MNIDNIMRLDNDCIQKYLSEDYFTFFVNYYGDLNKELSDAPYACAIELGYNIYAVPVKKENLTDFYSTFSKLLTIEGSFPYTLTEIEPVEAANILRFHNDDNLGLRGQGTVAIIIDTGIDYLNSQFLNDDNTTRVRLIWDQSIQSTQEPNNITYYGTVYTREEINRAIASHLNGEDPYAIVPSKDEIGHGTNMAGLVGAKGLNGVIGGAPECEFVIIKLKESKSSNLNLVGIYDRKNIPIFDGVDILNAIRFVDQYQNNTNLPTAVLLSLGTNWTSHEGASFIERSIDAVSSRKGLTFVTNSGNQGASSTHTSGTFKSVGEIQNIEVNIDEGEKNFSVIVWVPLPNLLTASVVSPTGEVAALSESATLGPIQYEQINLVLENSKITFSYSITDATNGNQVIFISIENPKAGVWQFRLKSTYIVDGTYNMWLPQRPLILPETRFINANPYTTIQAPSMARKAITTSFYNQINNTININSGRGYTVNNIVKPDLTTGGENALTTGLNNENVVVNGGSVAGAVLCGAVLLLLQWGIVDGNDPNMYSTSIISYLTRGTAKRPGDIYPNPQWGYGMLNLQGAFENLRLSSLRETTAEPSNKSIATSTSANSYLVYYTGNAISEINAVPESKVIPLTPYIAAVFVSPEYDSRIKSITSINILESAIPYILTDVSPLDSANITPFTQGSPIDLTGTGVVVALIDTGIDYLNKEFIREDDTSRILSIWDQTNNSGVPPTDIDYGSVYSNELINKAIKDNLAGSDPFSTVPQKDTIGHGTESAGIIGARGYGEVRGAAPNCEFVVVKLRPMSSFETIPGDSSTSIPIYNSIDICTAIKYVCDFKKNTSKPMVIFLPVSSNFGGHAGNQPIEEIIDYYSFTLNAVFALGTGNQGNSETHYSGTIENTNGTSTIELQVGENQNNLNLSIWVTSPDKISIGLVSPSGQEIKKIPVKLSKMDSVSFLYEKTTVAISYIFPEVTSRNEAISIDFSDLAKGIWKIVIFGDYIVNGQFNAWITQRPLSNSDTLIINSDNFITLSIPSTSNYAITTACYNQNNNSLYPLSGVGFTTDNRYKPEIATGGINVLTTTLNNKTTTITGSSAATAVLAGAIALILQWSIVENNLPNISALVIKSFLMRGASQFPTSSYPNQFVGYGLLDLIGSFDALRGVYKNVQRPGVSRSISKCDDNIEVHIPISVYKLLMSSYLK